MDLLKRGVLILKIGLAVPSKHQSIFTSFESSRGSLLELLGVPQSFLRYCSKIQYRDDLFSRRGIH